MLFISCQNSNGDFVLSKKERIYDLYDMCLVDYNIRSDNRSSDCKCISKTIGRHLWLKDLIGFTNAFSKVVVASDIDYSIVGEGIAHVVSRDEVYAITSEMKKCCTCSDLCIDMMYMLFAVFEENHMARDIYYYPAWFEDWCKIDLILPYDGNNEIELSNKNIVSIMINDKGRILVAYGSSSTLLQIDELSTYCESVIKNGNFSEDGTSSIIFSIITDKHTKYQDYIAVLDKLKRTKYNNKYTKEELSISKISIANPTE